LIRRGFAHLAVFGGGRFCFASGAGGFGTRPYVGCLLAGRDEGLSPRCGASRASGDAG